MKRHWYAFGVNRTHVRMKHKDKVEEVQEMSDEVNEVPEEVVFDFDMPDIPMPEEDVAQLVIEDKFPAACKFAFLGIGRAGSRIVEGFHKLGYARVCAINTAKQDLQEIQIPEKNKLWLGGNGAGGIRTQGMQYTKDKFEEIVDLMRNSYGTDFDRIMVCVGAGGGTGSGGMEVAVGIANALVEHMRIKKVGDKTRVGLMLALPTNSEKSHMANAYEAMKYVEKQLEQQALSPVIIIDNESVSKLHPGATVGNVWGKINQSAVTLLHTFNAICVAPTKHIALDPADLGTILESGLITYGATPLRDVAPEKLSQAMTNAVKQNVLCAGFDISSATIAGCILAGEANVLDSLNAQDIDKNCFEKLERITDGASVHRGIYTTKRPLAAYTMFGGLALPKVRLDEVAKLCGKDTF